MYTWTRAGDVAATCLIAGAVGLWLGLMFWLIQNIAYLCMGMEPDPTFTWVMEMT